MSKRDDMKKAREIADQIAPDLQHLAYVALLVHLAKNTNAGASSKHIAEFMTDNEMVISVNIEITKRKP